MTVPLPTPRRALRTLSIGLFLILAPYLLANTFFKFDIAQGSKGGNVLSITKRPLSEVGLPLKIGQANVDELVELDQLPITGVEENIEQKPVIMPSHVYLDNGLVRVNPEGRHPIYDLIDESSKAWQKKKSAASKTLSQAVEEYHRRYHRSPPKGFDRWWSYVQKNNVQLPDEYDQIHKDLEPFFAFTPQELRRRMDLSKKLGGMYSIMCKSKQCQYQIDFDGLNEEGTKVARMRAEAQLELFKEIETELENVEAVFYSHDGPWQFVDHEFRSTLEEAANLGEFVDVNEYHHDTAGKGWSAGCAPDKALAGDYDPKVLPDLEAAWQGEKTFVWDHKKVMDPCEHPTSTHLIGYLSSHGGGKGPGPNKDLYPVMAMCKTPLHSDVLGVSMEAWTEDVGDDPSWEEKMDERLLWRGKTTGTLFRPDKPWNISQRINLVDHGARTTGSLPILPAHDSISPVGLPHPQEMSTLNTDLVDVGFVDVPIQCEGETCTELFEHYAFKKRMSFSEGNKYKYIIDVDGNGWSARFKRLMSTNSLILKSTIFPEWYTDRVQPWIHYVPLKADLTDLYDVMTFFRANDPLAKEIASSGKEWSLTYWRRQDMVAYQYRLVLELSRLMSLDREASSFKPRGKDRQVE